MFNLLQKELLSYLKTPLAYFVLVIYLLLSLTVTLFMGQYLQVSNATLISFFLLQPQVMANIIPALTMKLWAEENKNGTIELLLTQPLSYTKIVIAKFFAAFIFGSILLISSFLFWGYSAWQLSLDSGIILAAYLACFLTMGMFVAIGCIISSLNKNVITAYVITVFLCWIIPYINFDFLLQAYILSPIWTKIVQSLNFYKHYQDLISGQIGFDNIIYYVCFTILALWINKVIIETKVATHRYRKSLSFAAFITTLIIIFIFTNISAALLFGDYKLDCSKDKKYSLSSASREIASKIQSPLKINVYISSDLSDSYPSLALYSQYVLRHLNQYASFNPDNISITTKDPKPYSDIESEAQEAGIKPLLATSGKNNMYFGASFTNANGQTKLIPLFIEERQEYLEYDLSRVLHKFNGEPIKTLGIIAPAKFKEQYIAKYLAHEYDVEYFSPDVVEIPPHIQSLMVVNPTRISEVLVYAIDQFALRGGGTLLLLDPYSENSANLNSTMGFREGIFHKYLSHLGIEFDNQFIVGDSILGQNRVINNRLQQFYPWINTGSENASSDTPLLKNISLLSLHTSGALNLQDEKMSLLTTSPQSGLIPTGAASWGEQGLIDSFENQARPFTVAGLVEGNITSAFDDNIITNPKAVAYMLPYLSSSLNPAKIAIIADSDFIYDDVWVQPVAVNNNDIYGVSYLNNNGEFLTRVIDYLNHNTILISVTSQNMTISQDTIEDKINSAINARYFRDYNQTMQKLTVLEDEINQLNIDVVEKDKTLTLSAMKILQDKEDEYSMLLRKAQHLDYKMIKEREHQINTIIIWNLVFIPLIALLILCLSGFNIYLINKRKALELANEKS